MKGGKRGHDVTAGRSSATGPAAGLRERKKQRTRATPLRSSCEFFTAKKYEETTVDEIADAVEVSQRTFSRSFASTKEAAFTV